MTSSLLFGPTAEAVAANTKTKADVAFSGKKPWRQKGTGRARAGYASSPVWSGGGVAFGPKPRDYSKKVPKSVRQACFVARHSVREFWRVTSLVAEEIKVATPKTKEFITFLKSQPEAQKVLVISTKFDEVTYKAARNIQPVLLNTAAEVNTEQLLQFQKIIVTNEALAKLAERLA